MRTTSQSTCLHETLATVAIIKIDPLERLLICNATSKNHKAYFISLLQKDSNRNYSVINYRVPEKRQKLPGKEKIGATGFEPATSRPPAVRATKLRHTPTKLIYTR